MSWQNVFFFLFFPFFFHRIGFCFSLHAVLPLIWKNLFALISEWGFVCLLFFPSIWASVSWRSSFHDKWALFYLKCRSSPHISLHIYNNFWKGVCFSAVLPLYMGFCVMAFFLSWYKSIVSFQMAFFPSYLNAYKHWFPNRHFGILIGHFDMMFWYDVLTWHFNMIFWHDILTWNFDIWFWPCILKWLLI